jgi:glycylpeptide N-tetradecanoyltransferase
VDVGFAQKPPGKNLSAFIKMHRLPEENQIVGMRPMQAWDVPEVTTLLNKHLSEHYKVHIVLNSEEVAHWLLPRPNVIYGYVV